MRYLPGSETVLLETRDRRNPEVVISRETLARSIDYNLDAANGRLFFLRYVSTFDSVLNLKQIVVTYEHRATGLATAVYTARAQKNFKRIGLKLGLSAVLQREAEGGNFLLGGIDAEKTLPNHGSLQMAWARSNGEVVGSGNVFSTDGNTRHDGDAYQLTIAEPLPFFNGNVKARYLNASAGFFNPFGGTVTPGSQRAEAALELNPFKTFEFAVRRNRRAQQDRQRQQQSLTYGAALDQILGEKIKLHFGFDHRDLTDNLSGKSTSSDLVTAAIDVHATDKLNFTVKREQNLGEADPTYPDQTTIGANYQINSLTKLFFTQRLAAASITPIGDYTGTGFASVSSRRETAIGVETRFSKSIAATGRYQLENGINGTDSFAVLGLQNHLPITKQLSLELGFERGFHLTGPNRSFNSGTVGFGWQPNSDFRATARYEYRDRGGVGQVMSFGAAGRIAERHHGAVAHSVDARIVHRPHEFCPGRYRSFGNPSAGNRSLWPAAQLQSSLVVPGWIERTGADARFTRHTLDRRLLSTMERPRTVWPRRRELQWQRPTGSALRVVTHLSDPGACAISLFNPPGRRH